MDIPNEVPEKTSLSTTKYNYIKNEMPKEFLKFEDKKNPLEIWEQKLEYSKDKYQIEKIALIEIWEQKLEYSKDKYQIEKIALTINYKNNLLKKVIGVIVDVKIKNPFGDILFENKYKDAISIMPIEKYQRSDFWIFENNPFIKDEIFDKLLQVVKNNNYKIETKIEKIIYED